MFQLDHFCICAASAALAFGDPFPFHEGIDILFEMVLIDQIGAVNE
jgi:hypothetical protein